MIFTDRMYSGQEKLNRSKASTGGTQYIVYTFEDITI